ncbi:MAG: hypothetical protein U1G05_01735 [Kiritimatiellia bacterium]
MADGETKHQRVIDVMNACAAAGCTNVTIGGGRGITPARTMPDDPVSAPWRRMKRAGLALSAVCALLLPLFYHALRRRLDRHLRTGLPRTPSAASPACSGSASPAEPSPPCSPPSSCAPRPRADPAFR